MSGANGSGAHVAVVAPSWLGDAVMSLPLVSSLSASGARVTVVASPYSARVYSGAPGVADLVVIEKSIRARASVMRRIGVDAVVLLPPSFSSAVAALLSGVGTRVGYATDGRRLLLTDPVNPRGLREEHLTDNYARLGRRALERLGLPPVDSGDPEVRVYDSERESVRQLLNRYGVGRDYAVVVPGATYGPTKSWPADRYHGLVAGLGREMDVVLAGGARERALCDRVAEGSSARNLAGSTSLGDLFALVESAAVVVANDSGVPHVSGALGVPTVVVFGSTSPRWTKPLGDAVHVVRHPVHCSPCFRRECPTNLECYAGITVDDVLEATSRAQSAVHSSGA